MNQLEQFNKEIKTYSVSHNGVKYSDFQLYLHTTYPENIKTSQIRLSFFASNKAKETVNLHKIFFPTGSFTEIEDDIKQLATHKDFPKLDEIATEMICLCVSRIYLELTHIPSKLV